MFEFVKVSEVIINREVKEIKDGSSALVGTDLVPVEVEEEVAVVAVEAEGEEEEEEESQYPKMTWTLT